MTTVRVIKNWSEPDLFKQTPGGTGIWHDIRFVDSDVRECDYAVVLNYSTRALPVVCPKDNVWVLLQEPPNECFDWWHRADRTYKKVLTCDPSLKGTRYCASHPAVPWHVNKSYEFLSMCRAPDKPLALSWVTSNQGAFRGHRKRLTFLDNITGRVRFDLFGRGFKPIDDKWDGIAPYRYSLAIENFSGLHYWTEKLADCFLGWTMPIYYGCTNIEEYFPPESMIRIDIDDPDVHKQILDVIKSDLWIKRRDAVARARELYLNRYQFFPHVAALVHDDIAGNQSNASKRTHIEIPGESKASAPLLYRIRRKLRSLRRPSEDA